MEVSCSTVVANDECYLWHLAPDQAVVEKAEARGWTSDLHCIFKL